MALVYVSGVHDILNRPPTYSEEISYRFDGIYNTV